MSNPHQHIHYFFSHHHLFTKFHLILASLIAATLSICIATPTFATSNPLPSRAALSATIDRVENFAEYQTYASLGTSGANRPHYKEYAHLRSLVAEINDIHTNYDTIASSDDSWKIAYLIDYSADALKGCEYLFGLKKQSSASSTTNSKQSVPSASTSNTSNLNDSTSNSSHSENSNPNRYSSHSTQNHPATDKPISTVSDNSNTNSSTSNNSNIPISTTSVQTADLTTSQNSSPDALNLLTLPCSVCPLVRPLVQLGTNVPTHPDQLDLPRRRAFFVESV